MYVWRGRPGGRSQREKFPGHLRVIVLQDACKCLVDLLEGFLLTTDPNTDCILIALSLAIQYIFWDIRNRCYSSPSTAASLIICDVQSHQICCSTFDTSSNHMIQVYTSAKEQLATESRSIRKCDIYITVVSSLANAA